MAVKLRVDLNAVLDSVDEYLESEAQQLVLVVTEDEQQLKEDSLFTFVDCMKIENMDSFVDENNCKDCPGVYIFKLTENVQIGTFNDTNYASQIKEEFVLSKQDFDKNEILYLGKSENDIATRINQHIKNNTEKTYSLRLNDNDRKHLYGKLKVYIFVLKKEYKKYNKVIVAGVEGYLHKSLKPVVGSKRL